MEELVNEIYGNPEWSLTDEEFADDVNIIKRALLSTLGNHVTIIAADIMREHLGFDPPDIAVSKYRYAAEESLSNTFDQKVTEPGKFKDSVWTVLENLKGLLIGSEIMLRAYLVGMPEEEFEALRSEAARAKQEHGY